MIAILVFLLDQIKEGAHFLRHPVDDNELLLEDEEISDASLESLEVLEENSLEYDLELTDAIAVVNLSALIRILVESDFNTMRISI